MKDTITDASRITDFTTILFRPDPLMGSSDFPRTRNLRVYHLGVRAGEVANRIVTVGSPSRAQMLGSFLDNRPPPFELSSERGFLTVTGRYRGTPVSIVSIGMGFPNMDFFVREARECLVGDMVVVRLGSCGALMDVPVGSVVIPKASIAVMRNVDYDFGSGESEEPPYRISRPAYADVELHDVLNKAMSASSDHPVIGEAVNASADSFYSSQGRQTSFMDHNSDLIERLQSSTPGLATLEMETFHLFHLAACWNAKPAPRQLPLTTTPVHPDMLQPLSVQASGTTGNTLSNATSSIKAAAVHMVFASRSSQDFITPQQVVDLEAWTGRHVLTVLSDYSIDKDRLHPEKDSVWRLEPDEQGA